MTDVCFFLRVHLLRITSSVLHCMPTFNRPPVAFRSEQVCFGATACSPLHDALWHLPSLDCCWCQLHAQPGGALRRHLTAQRTEAGTVLWQYITWELLQLRAKLQIVTCTVLMLIYVQDFTLQCMHNVRGLA
jgi:hypothetical protein